MTRTISIFTTLILTILASVEIATAQDTIREFGSNVDEIYVSGAFDVTVVPETKTTVQFSTSAAEKVNITTRSGKLIITQRNDKRAEDPKSADQRIKLRVGVANMADLEEVDVEGYSKLTLDAKGVLIKSLELSASGASELVVKVQAKELEVDVDGASTAVVTANTTQEISYEVSGASKLIHNGDFKKLDLDVSGSSKATLSGVGDKVDIDASGVSSIDASALRAKVGKVDASGLSKIKTNILDPVISASGLSRITNKN